MRINLKHVVGAFSVPTQVERKQATTWDGCTGLPTPSHSAPEMVCLDIHPCSNTEIKYFDSGEWRSADVEIKSITPLELGDLVTKDGIRYKIISRVDHCVGCYYQFKGCLIAESL